ncbi:CYTH domain-containing protein [Sinorhizobium meliloti]|nr:CYTH domain-containing protein [Sinorhizobium meliloti]
MAPGEEPFGQSPTILRQTSVYFDTVEGDLSKRGLSLRIRQCGEESIERYPEATVLNLGCGLDSRIFRIDPGPGVRWFELDFPDAFA